GLQEMKGDVETILRAAHPLRLEAAYTVIKQEGEGAIQRIHEITGFDPYFLYVLYEQSLLDRELEKGLTPELLKRAKENGMSDKRIALLSGVSADEVRAMRDSDDVHIAVHCVDTCAGETRAVTPYCYTTYGEADETEPLGEDAVIILGCDDARRPVLELEAFRGAQQGGRVIAALLRQQKNVPRRSYACGPVAQLPQHQDAAGQGVPWPGQGADRAAVLLSRPILQIMFTGDVIRQSSQHVSSSQHRPACRRWA
ncbi:MAG: hypothetical protein MSS62_09105, partial [Desulfovibrio piger]|nr:hypothetical protein [Desulfovibrio piger]